MSRKTKGRGEDSGKAQRPPAGEPWVWLTRELLRSAAWRSLGINARRLIDFLLLEHMGHAGRHNGKLKAPHRQLVVHGIGARHVRKAILDAEEAGLVLAHRGGMRVATTFTLTWLPLHDGHPPHSAWREFTGRPSAEDHRLPSAALHRYNRAAATVAVHACVEGERVGHSTSGRKADDNPSP